ncbi:MAG: tRNA (N6-threonylcarbamoyladenosine(37)-N6)-methyltransferase TrmO, partial [candidate division WOR-3 bacterium]|nr:tRNA (N6-threonylcarbamoyladenosine(37)-N6)-methyltransferase TrmO [candidate division WOR-3 bacterium]
TIEVFPEYMDGLQDLDGFSHIIVLTHFHLIKDYKLKVIPYMDNKKRGVFATRAPARPNPIGLSIVRLMKIDENILHIRDIDIIDKTPILDIKPFVHSFNTDDSITIGWLDKQIHKLPESKDDSRFIPSNPSPHEEEDK